MQAINFLENSKVIKSLLLAIFGSVLLTISAKLQTPFTLVPATMQTFVVLLIGMILGPRLAATTVILYLFQGSIGIPVFAKGGGFMYLAGPTGGYLLGFIFAAYFSGFIKKDLDPILIFIYLSISISIAYIVGLLGLWNFMGFDKNFSEVFNAGAKPFLIIEIYKILILSVLSKQLFKIKKFI
jgi:biotin transport system substrate-specific component|tara:strand:+ start:362 stop:910 length:549 start_codon:yes stop_codon:yes gene_type:complete